MLICTLKAHVIVSNVEFFFVKCTFNFLEAQILTFTINDYYYFEILNGTC
jgi:hypothetical protein